MPNDCEFSTFPSTRNEALTILYLQQQDLSNLSISEIAQKYTDANNAFKEAFKEQRQR